jgi:hypothetical protein
MSKLHGVSIVLLCVVLVVVVNGLHDNLDDEDRKPSMFKVGDDWLALPEVFSNLDFAADNAPASEEDIAGQKKLRDTRFWGRLYLDGWPQTIQFFRAHFGTSAPMGKKTFVFAEPRDACGELTNSVKLTQDHVVLVNRGTCTYGQKAKHVQNAGASAIIIINNEPGLDHLPGPDAHDIEFSVSSIPQQEGQLLESIYDEGPITDGGMGREITGYMVPINCENSGARCLPATYEERRAVETVRNGGLVHVSGQDEATIKEGDHPLEYLLAHFGVMTLHGDVSTPIVVAQPSEACGPITNDVRNKVVLVRRGGCPFVKKAEEVQSAGGKMMVLGNSASHIVRVGVEPRWKGLNTVIPVVMVSSRVYGALVAERMLNPNLEVRFEDSEHVSGNMWGDLEKLAQGDGWPRSEAYVQKKYEELVEEHKAWPDRVATVEDAYKKKQAKKINLPTKEEL